MSAMRHQLHKATSANVSIPEIILLLLLARIAWHNRKDKQWLPVAYCVFLILYITLLRRVPGYNETIRLHLKLLLAAGREDTAKPYDPQPEKYRRILTLP